MYIRQNILEWVGNEHKVKYNLDVVLQDNWNPFWPVQVIRQHIKL